MNAIMRAISVRASTCLCRLDSQLSHPGRSSEYRTNMSNEYRTCALTLRINAANMHFVIRIYVIRCNLFILSRLRAELMFPRRSVTHNYRRNNYFGYSKVENRYFNRRAGILYCAIHTHTAQSLLVSLSLFTICNSLFGYITTIREENETGRHNFQLQLFRVKGKTVLNAFRTRERRTRLLGNFSCSPRYFITTLLLLLQRRRRRNFFTRSLAITARAGGGALFNLRDVHDTISRWREYDFNPATSAGNFPRSLNNEAARLSTLPPYRTFSGNLSANEADFDSSQVKADNASRLTDTDSLFRDGILRRLAFYGFTYSRDVEYPREMESLDRCFDFDRTRWSSQMR